MSTTVNLACVNLNKTDYYNPSTVYPRTSLDTLQEFGYKSLVKFFISFESLSSSYQYRNYESLKLVYTGRAKVNTAGLVESHIVEFHEITEAWNPQTITYDNKPYDSTKLGTVLISSSSDVTKNVGLVASLSYLRNVLSNGILFYSDMDGGYFYAKGSNSPYLILTFDDINAYLAPYSLSPISGYIPKYSANTFNWSTKQNGSCVGTLEITNCKFRWRTSSSAAYTEIDCGTSLSCTIPANTFTTDEIQWSVAITDNGGTTTSSDWYTLSTEEVTSTATADSPKNTMIDGSVANTFSWSHIISTGTAQTKADLQKSTTGSTWTTLATITGSAQTTTIAASTFTSGQWYWRVRTYNTDNVAGSWSEAASFISVASPVLQGVTATQTPRPTVSWQCSDQQGYQVKIGDYDSGVRFGTAQSFRYPAYLADGTYTVKVRTVNQYGLWSSWVTASCAVSNTAGTAITLAVSHSDAVAELTWTTSETYAAFILYRDNVPIYKGTDTSYTDNLAIGAVSYKVRGVYSDSENYTLSNIVDVELSVDCMMVADINSFEWMKLDKSTSSACETDLSHTGESVVEHISGTAYPVLELSEYKDLIISGRVAFTDSVQAKAFAKLSGRCVVLKTTRGDMAVGLMNAVSEVQNTFYHGFSFSVQHTFLLEEVDI